MYPLMQEYDKESAAWLAQQGKEVSFDWWKQSDDPKAQEFRMYFDKDNKELLAKYPRGFNLYYNVVLRMLNPDRSSWQFLDLSDDKIDIIRESG